tara:strand:- start:404 stop:1126 length:723 start_codon:yes stop_codon:yes gene_type:complete
MRTPGREKEVTVIKLSGSLFSQKALGTLPKFLSLFTKIRSQGCRLVLVAGGGDLARSYISAGRRLGADEGILDEIGIAASRIHARLIVAGLGTAASPTIPTNLEELSREMESNKIVILGGLHPGHSTNAVAALAAERTGASLLINSTDVDGVYTGDPHTDRSARKLKAISVSKLSEMLSDLWMGAGTYDLMDIVALKIIERSKIPTRIVKCSVEILGKVIRGDDVGTFINFRESRTNMTS